MYIGKRSTVLWQVDLEKLEMRVKSVSAMREEVETEAKTKLKASWTRIAENYADLNGCRIVVKEYSESRAPVGDLTSNFSQERTDVSRAKADNRVTHRARRPRN